MNPRNHPWIGGITNLRLGLGLGGDSLICLEQDFLTRAQVLGGIYKP